MLRQRAEDMMADYAHGEDSLTLPAPDDLKRIEGIGHKISSLLQEAGVTTFAQLAATEIAGLETILDTAGMHFADPGNWPEQAQLAADGKWDDLAALQHELKGGRRAG
jgi:predicted flap endonuclease-1-like 5' DNA nuclease